MALGGGNFTVQNKILPGAYVSFVSLAKASAPLGNRGTVAMGLELDWGKENEIFTIEKEDFLKKSNEILGYGYTNGKLKELRDLFLNAKTLLAYRLNMGGTKASNSFATAKYAGVRGNNIKIIVKKNLDDNKKFDVSTVVDGQVFDMQSVKTPSEFKSNDWVEFKHDAILKVTAAEPMSGGTNGTITGEKHQSFLGKLEGHTYNTLGLSSEDEATKSLYIAYIKRMRDEIGAKAQLVVHNKPADYEGVVNVKNTTAEGNTKLVYWVAGVMAGTAVNKSALNKEYDGEFSVNGDYTQSQLKKAISDGELVLHKVGSHMRILKDINSLVSVTDEKGEDFKLNQTVRTIDQIAKDIANLFATKYLGNVPNDASGRISLWADIVKHHEQLQNIRAIEDFKGEDIKVEMGETKSSVVVSDKVKTVGAMAKLYMRVVIA